MHLEHSETWRFRCEAPADISTWLSFGWGKHGAALADFSLSAEWGPDGGVLMGYEGTLVLRAEGEASLRTALETAVGALVVVADSHVAVESLKPATNYDGERDGPFAWASS